MNAELITREAHSLLQEVAGYEEPRLFLDEAPTLSGIAKQALRREAPQAMAPSRISAPKDQPLRKGHIKDTNGVSDTNIKDRREAVLSVIRDKGRASIKDISTLIRDVSEKTIQRELLALISAGMVLKQGERRWSTYSLP
ncbi:MAG: hypothetical protein B7W98_00085 [Parcubacteria group bacterium 20-58-5]|nr:MAG: hypothetical protein B7W98_00085 [Parcubacteria group bacterium 20-58-5]